MTQEGGNTINYFKYSQALIILLFAMVSANFGVAQENSRYEVTLGMDGDVMFVKKGWFKNEFYPIRLIRGEWHWKSLDGWKRIATPYESVFDRGGRIIVLGELDQIYLRTKDRTEKYPLKVINGTWHWFEGGEWLEIPFEVD
jgi:hypothetical protein